MFRVKRERKRRRLSVQEFAKRIGVTRNTVYCWERGDFNISAESAVKISQTFNIPIQKILAGGEK